MTLKTVAIPQGLDFLQVISALREITEELVAIGNPANLDSVDIWNDEQDGLSTNLETGEKTPIEEVTEVTELQ